MNIAVFADVHGRVALCFGVLRWTNRGNHSFEVVDEVWLDRYNSFTRKYR